MKNSFWKKKKVLITGHEGFLGSWLTKTLLDKGAEVVGVDRVYKRPKSVLKGLRKDITCIKGDISDFKLVRKIINKHKPKIIFHVAAEAIVGRANNSPVEAFKSNIEGTWNLLESSREKGFIESLIVASSDKAYGSHKSLPYTEDTPLKGANPYDASKTCADVLAYTYYNAYNVPVCITRCGNIYGPGDLNFSRIIPDAIKSIISKKQFIIRSDGKFTRDYIHVSDIVSGYLLIAENMRRKRLFGQAFNFSNEKPITVLNLFKKISSVFGDKVCTPKILNRAANEIRHQYLSSKKSKSVLGWKPHYTLESGLQEAVEWYSQVFKK